MTVRQRSLSIHGGVVLIRPAGGAELVDLRHRILRQGLPRTEAIFAGDELETSLHVGAFVDGRNVGCATYHLNTYEHEPAYQLRGMAVDDGLRKTGVGRSMLSLAEELLRQRGPIRLLWCNARTPAVGFYQRQGWRAVSGEFFIETAGPHFRMIKRIEA